LTFQDAEFFRSVQNPDAVHIAPLGAATTIAIPKPSADDKSMHQTTVHTTQGELNFVDPFKTQILQPEATPAKLAEAAAASAFELFPPHTPLTTPPPTDTVFAPKISSTDLYSEALSPTGQYQNMTPAAVTDTTKYERETDSQVFGGHDTSAGSKKHPQGDVYGRNPAHEAR
jgi:hypothetical protein